MCKRSSCLPLVRPGSELRSGMSCEPLVRLRQVVRAKYTWPSLPPLEASQISDMCRFIAMMTPLRMVAMVASFFRASTYISGLMLFFNIACLVCLLGAPLIRTPTQAKFSLWAIIYVVLHLMGDLLLVDGPLLWGPLALYIAGVSLFYFTVAPRLPPYRPTVATLSHCCYTVVTFLVHCRHTAVTLLLHSSHLTDAPLSLLAPSLTRQTDPFLSHEYYPGSCVEQEQQEYVPSSHRCRVHVDVVPCHPYPAPIRLRRPFIG
jgi:hypothetical protein